ncbi:THAP domain-containing protein 2-like isoform X2 [Leptopilina boulardi]|uniref:THAP domain-containing protein 2-like isoform X2 n=1 Tax=Leptopilina boulardi TaxID=63433 RepID=UPI0021F65687|nr:THAP domain-containing protein 2-like isoform X2 [Leptopilina boulardi]
MGVCSAEGCQNKSYKDCMLSFHSFPLEDPVRLKKWLQAINKESWTPKKEHRVCSIHFQPDDFRSSGKRKRLRKDAIPCLNLQKSSVENTTEVTTTSSAKTSKNNTIICTTENDDKNNILKLDISNLVIKSEQPSITNEKQRTIKQEVKNIMAVNLLRNVKTKGNVKMILCKRGPNLDAGTSGSSTSKIIQNIPTETKMILPTLKLNPKQEITRLRTSNEELLKKVKNLEKLATINEKLTERVKYLEKLVQDLQTKNKVETKNDEISTDQKLKGQIVGIPRTEFSVYSLQKYVDSDHCYSSSPKTLKRKVLTGLEGLREKKKKVNTWQRRISRTAIKHDKLKRIVKESPD